ncbi:MAG: TetR/AcrR family transcriptional regulator [Endozoicomonas sp.]
MSDSRKLSKSKEALIRAAERLLAEKGLEGASDREIAKAAGQKNNSAVQYHFGDRTTLIEAILDYRMLPLNKARSRMLEALDQQELTVRKLVEVMVIPYIHHLLERPDDSHYIRLFSQLYQRSGREIVANGARASALYQASEEIQKLLSDIPRSVLHARINLAGMQLIHTASDWDIQRRKHPERWTESELLTQTDILIDYIVGGLVHGLNEFDGFSGS